MLTQHDLQSQLAVGKADRFPELTRMLEGRDVGEKSRWVRNTLTKIGREDEQIILPRRVGELQSSHQSVSEGHTYRARAKQRYQLPILRHDVSSYQATQWSC